MDFTALHRELGYQPCPLTDEMIDEAVRQRIGETDDLDWKSALPREKDIAVSDTVKDIAAMANSGGGLIVFGVAEQAKKATARADVGEVSEGFERTLRKVAVSGIHPPVFGLGVYRLGAECRALAVVVPPSVDVPHLIYRNDYFGAPVRNDADTEWMRERQLEALYRVRLDERRSGDRALGSLYEQAAMGRDVLQRAWFVGVARPRIPVGSRQRMELDEVRDILSRAESLALRFASRRGVHPLESVDRSNPRPGLRRWVARNTATSPTTRWKEAWVSVHHDGTVSMASAVGGHRMAPSGEYAAGSVVDSTALECSVADLMAAARATSNAVGTRDYEVRLGIEWVGKEPLHIQTTDQHGYLMPDISIPLAIFAPITASIRTDVDEDGYLAQVHDLAQDTVNQGGVQHLRLINGDPKR